MGVERRHRRKRFELDWNRTAHIVVLQQEELDFQQHSNRMRDGARDVVVTEVDALERRRRADLLGDHSDDQVVSEPDPLERGHRSERRGYRPI
mgnify:FL=1